MEQEKKQEPAGGAGAPVQRGLNFTPGWAQLLLWAVLFLGVGVLALLKSRGGRSAPAEPPPPVEAPAPVEDEPASAPAKAPAPKPAAPAPSTEVNLEDDGTTPPPAPKKAPPRPRKAPPAEDGTSHEIQLE